MPTAGGVAMAAGVTAGVATFPASAALAVRVAILAKSVIFTGCSFGLLIWIYSSGRDQHSIETKRNFEMALTLRLYISK